MRVVFWIREKKIKRLTVKTATNSSIVEKKKNNQLEKKKLSEKIYDGGKDFSFLPTIQRNFPEKIFSILLFFLVC